MPPGAGDINDVGNASRSTQQVAAPTTALPIIYGRERTKGFITVVHVDDTENASFLYIAIAFAVPCTTIEKLFVDSIDINDAEDGLLAIEGADYELHPTGGASAILTAAISGYADTPNACYVVLKIPKAYTRGFPQVEAIIRGVAVYDPRGPTTAYSNNAALCFADLITRSNNTYLTASLIEAANYCDDPVGSAPRRTIGLALIEQRPLENWAKVFRMYTGCFLVWENGSIRFIPDKAVSLPGDVAQHFGADDIVKGSMTVRRRGSPSFPNIVIVEYRDATDDNEWHTNRAVFEGVDITPPRVSRVSLPGIHTYAQAYREAKERQLKFTSDIALEMLVFDIGVKLQVGSICTVTHPFGFSTTTFRITSLANDQGRWRLSVEGYDVANYSNDTEVAAAAYVSELGSPSSSIEVPGPQQVQRLTIGQCLVLTADYQGCGTMVSINDPSGDGSQFIGRMHAISADGSTVVASLQGNNENAVYVWTGVDFATETKIVIDATVANGRQMDQVAISADGSVIMAVQNPLGDGGPSVGPRVVMLSGASWATQTVLDTTTGGYNINTDQNWYFADSKSLSDDGSTVAFIVNENVGGSNFESHIFIYSGASWGTRTVITGPDLEIAEWGYLAFNEDASILAVSYIAGGL